MPQVYTKLAINLPANTVKRPANTGAHNGARHLAKYADLAQLYSLASTAGREPLAYIL